jgi:hypothetical protein
MLRSFDWAQDSARTDNLMRFHYSTVHPEPVEACPELDEGGERAPFQKEAL